MKIPYLSGLKVSGAVELKNLPELTNATRFLTLDVNNNVKWSVGSSGGGDVDLSNYFTKGQSDSRFQPIGNYLTSVNWTDILSKPTFFDGNYNSLTNRPNIPTLVSQLSNDSGYVTASIINGYATQSFVNSSIANLINSAPSTLDTLYELANALGNDANFSTTITNLIGTKANAVDVYTKSVSDGRYQPLENQRLSSGNNVTFNKVTAVNELLVPSVSSTNLNSIWIGEANSNGSTNPTIAYLRDLQDVSFTSLQNGQSIQYDSASGTWKNVNFQMAGNYANTNGSNAFGTWGINISGNAGTATNATNADKFVGYGYEGGIGNLTYILGFNGNTNNIGVATSGQIQSFLGLGSFAYRNSINGGEVLTGASDASIDIGVAKMVRWRAFGNGHVLFDASSGTAPDGSAIDRTNPTHHWGVSYPTWMGWNGANTFGIRVDSARQADNATLWNGKSVNYASFTSSSEITNLLGVNAPNDIVSGFSKEAIQSWLGLGASAYTAETLDSVAIRSNNIYRDIRINNGSTVFYWDATNNFAARGDTRDDVFHQYVHRASDGVAIAWKENWWNGSKYYSWTTDDKGFIANAKMRIITEPTENGSLTYQGGLEIQGTNAGITFHYPGYYAQPFWMNSVGTLHWAAALSVGDTVMTGRLVAGYDSGVAGSINTSDYLRVAGGGGVHWASYGTYLEAVDGNTIRFRGGAGTTVLQMTTNDGAGRGYLYGDSANNIGLLHHGGGWTIRSNSGRNIYLNETEGNTFIGTASGSEKLNVNGWVSTQGNHGYYFATHGGGIQMTDSTWLRVYNSKAFWVDNQVRGTDFRAGIGGYNVDNYGSGLVGVYSDVRYQAVFAMGDAYKLNTDGTGLANHYGIAWTHSNIGGQSKPVGHQMLITEAGITQTAIGKGIWTIADIYAQGKIEAPTHKATAKMVIPTVAPASPENGCIWIA